MGYLFFKMERVLKGAPDDAGAALTRKLGSPHE
jgi:hypothetical protein